MFSQHLLLELRENKIENTCKKGGAQKENT
jgi:hypothetical protein